MKRNKFAILISNRTGEQHTPHFVIDGKYYKGGINYRYVVDERLNATNGGNAEMEGSGKIEVRIQEWSGEADRISYPQKQLRCLDTLTGGKKANDICCR